MRRIEDDGNMQENSDGSIIVCDQSEILMKNNRLNESVRKALDSYKEYKHEISFTLQSQNDSRCFEDELVNHVDNLSSIVQRFDDETGFLSRTPISSQRCLLKKDEEKHN